MKEAVKVTMQILNALKPNQSITIEELAEQTGITIDEASDAVEQLVQQKALQVYRRHGYASHNKLHPLQVRVAK
jgi:DNA-binding IclR family transcriptional regulator